MPAELETRVAPVSQASGAEILIAIGALVARCEREGKTLDALTLEEFRAAHPAFESDVLAIDLDSALAARSAIGGTAPQAVAFERAAARARLAAEDGE